MKNPSVNSIVESANTDRELWRGPDEGNGSYYADSIHVTASGGIGIDVGGMVYVKPLRDWHRSATIISELQAADRDHLSAKRGMETRLNARIAELESSLSRIRGQTIELTPEMALAGARSIGNTADTDNHVQRARECWDAMMLARQGIKQPIPQGAAIRSLDKNCSGKTDAERGSTQKEGSR